MSRDINLINRKDAIAKWGKVEGPASLSNIKDPDVRENMAILLEAQDQHYGMITEASQAANTLQNLSTVGYLDGSQSDSAYQFKPIALALVRRTFPELFANKCVAVQAMNGPVGLAYALRVIYGTAQGANPDLVEAAFQNVDRFGGLTGSSAGLSAAPDNAFTNAGIVDTSATGATTSAAEIWQIDPTSASYPELLVKVDQTTITAKTRKIATSYTLESAQDLKAMHGIEIERDMINYLQYELIAELDRELLYRMKVAAVTPSKGGEVISTINVSGTNFDGRWSQEKFSNIISNLMYQSNRIAQTTRRGAGNFAVVSPAIATALQSAGAIFNRVQADVVANKAGVAEVGNLANQMTIYRDSYARVDYAMIGYKGPGISDAGIIYSPYITGLTNRAISPNDFSPRIGIMMRYALTDTLLNSGRYYRLIPFSNLNSLIASAGSFVF
jgi:hypothetical protein